MQAQAESIPKASRPSLQPLVSIVLPTYNRADRLQTALQSCLRQTYRNLEVIVVDDGSTDRTPEVVAAVQREDPRVRYFRQENQKLPAALNAGFRLSTGEFLTWISDDNQFHEDAIEVMANALSASPDVGLVYCDYNLVDAEGHFIRRVRRPGPECISHRNCVHACFMYRREVYETVGDYDPHWLYVEDYDYWLRVSKRFKLMHIPDVSPYSCAMHEGNLTMQLGPKQRLLDVQHRVRHAEPIGKKLRMFVATREEVCDLYSKLGNWRKAALAGLVFGLSEPWRRWKWLHAVKMVRNALRVKSGSTLSRT